MMIEGKFNIKYILLVIFGKFHKMLDEPDDFDLKFDKTVELKTKTDKTTKKDGCC